MRMEKIIMEKLYWKVKAPTALRFLRVFHSHVLEQLDAERQGQTVTPTCRAELWLNEIIFTLLKCVFSYLVWKLTLTKKIYFFFSQQAQSFLKSCRLLDMWQGVRKQICKSPPFSNVTFKKKKKKIEILLVGFFITIYVSCTSHSVCFDTKSIFFPLAWRSWALRDWRRSWKPVTAHLSSPK